MQRWAAAAEPKSEQEIHQVLFFPNLHIRSGNRQAVEGSASQKKRLGNCVVRTFNDWNEPEPGYLEIDLVAHYGDSVAELVHQHSRGHGLLLGLNGSDPTFAA